MASLGMANRQSRNITANAGTRYKFKIVGNSPEMCRGLDSHGFADLKAAVMAHASYTSVYPDKDNPRRFNLGTPAEVFRVLNARGPWRRRASASARTSSCPPSFSKRSSSPRAPRWRTRLCNMGDGPLVNKPRSFQRIETLASSVPTHPNVEPARKWIAIGEKGPLLL
jgi:hypothetical protein